MSTPVPDATTLAPVSPPGVINIDSCFSCIYLNARSLKSVSATTNKLLDFQNLVYTNRFDMVAVTETWLNCTVDNAEILGTNYVIHRKDRVETCPNTRGGGLLLAVNSGLNSKRRAELESPCEILVCEISSSRPCRDSPKTAIVLCYRPPSSDCAEFTQNLDKVLFNVSNEFSLVFVLGDFNLPNIIWTSTVLPSASTDFNFVNLMMSYSLDQINTFVSNEAGNVLDLVFTNSDSLIKDLSQFDCAFHTDHTVLYFELCLKLPRIPKTQRTKYNYREANIDSLNAALCSSNAMLLISLSNACDIDDMWCKWSECVGDIIDTHVPKVKVTISDEPPWIDREVRHMCNKKSTLYKKAKAKNTEYHWRKYNRQRNDVKSLVKRKHDDYIASLGDLCKSNPKKFWSFFRCKTKSRSTPSIIRIDSIELSDARAKASAFNNYFCSVFLPRDSCDLPLVLRDVSPISIPCFTVDEVISVLSHLDVKKASAPSECSSFILKNCRISLGATLTCIFNQSLRSGQVPLSWKCASVVPVFKKGDKNSVENYRPVSLLNCCSKVMERCIVNYLFPLVSPYLHPLQHGFIKNRSCTTQLLKVYHEIGQHLDRGEQIDIIFLDFSKAFDRVSHSHLLFKLQLFCLYL